MVPVESMLSTSFCAVPAFMRVEPVMTSGPVRGVMAISARLAMSEPSLQETAMVWAPSSLAYSSPPMT